MRSTAADDRTAIPLGLTRSLRVPIAYAVFSLIALVLFVLLARSGVTTFVLSTERDAIQLPRVPLPAIATGIVVTAALVALTGLAWFNATARRRTPPWVHVVFAVLFLVGFLTWAAVDAALPVPGLLVGTVALSVPLVFGGIGGVISERVGVVNVAIEGQLLAGAFASAVVASITSNAFAGLAAAAIAGALVATVLAVFSIKYWVDQVIVGIVLNVLVVGLTSFIYVKVLSPNASTLNSPPRFPTIDIPVLSQIPLIGPALFRQSIIVYLLYLVVAIVTYALFKTKWGLRVRAVGEHPEAADTAGIAVNRLRLWTVLLAGGIAGIGGAYFTLGSIGSFQQEMTAGMGYIALAAVILGRWNPINTTLAALLFGFATNLQYVLGVIGSPVPSEVLLMLPYVVTIVAVAGFIGYVRGPAAAGRPYASR